MKIALDFRRRLESLPVFAQGSLVPLFKSILEIHQAAIQPGDKRRMPRYAIGENFAFKTKLTLFQSGGAKTADAKGKEWSATAVNLSATGASVQLSLAAVAFQREPCRLKFTHKEYLLEIPATIAHFRCYSHYSLCGLIFNFSTPEQQREYLQLLEPVIIGNSFTTVKTTEDVDGRYQEQFGGTPSVTLTVWRDELTRQIIGFDFRMHHYGVRWMDGAAELEVYGVGETSPGREDLIALNETQLEEVRWLFCLAVPNLSKSVPQDVRKFLAALVAG